MCSMLAGGIKPVPTYLKSGNSNQVFTEETTCLQMMFIRKLKNAISLVKEQELGILAFRGTPKPIRIGASFPFLKIPRE